MRMGPYIFFTLNERIIFLTVSGNDKIFYNFLYIFLERKGCDAFPLVTYQQQGNDWYLTKYTL